MEKTRIAWKSAVIRRTFRDASLAWPGVFIAAGHRRPEKNAFHTAAEDGELRFARPRGPVGV